VSDKSGLEIASELGYKGDSNKEAKNWILAIEKGLDVSDDARHSRASEMGFNTNCVFYHGTGEDFDTFDKSKIGQNYNYAEDSGFFFTKKFRVAKNHAYMRSGGKGGRVISAFLNFSNPQKASTDSEYWNPADRFDINGHNMMHDARIEGSDSIFIKGTHNDDLCVVFEPSQILSIHAAFDPDTESHVSNTKPMYNEKAMERFGNIPGARSLSVDKSTKAETTTKSNINRSFRT
jgi:hypothetical protein